MNRRKAIWAITVAILGVIFGIITLKRFGNNRSALGQVDDFKELISELAEVIIPQTHTPGAKEAKVFVYIVNMVNNCFSVRDKKIFLKGLMNVEKYSFSRFQSSFLQCNEPERNQVMAYFENKGSYSNRLLNKVRRKVQGPTFYEQLRWLTVSGYCTSKLGATKGLAYTAIPGGYSSCIPLVPGQRSWATK